MKTLVLDLDETLVRSQFKKPPHHDLKLNVNVDEKHCQVFVAIRPGTKEFLEKMAKHYEVVIFTASLSNYANPLMDKLDPEGLCTSRLFREHCTFNGRFFVKDMSLMGRRMEDIILVDNNPNSYVAQPENGMPIISWFDDQKDTELYKLTPLLVGLSTVPDVRVVLAKSHQGTQLDLNLALMLTNEINRKNLKIPDETDSDLNDRVEMESDDFFQDQGSKPSSAEPKKRNPSTKSVRQEKKSVERMM